MLFFVSMMLFIPGGRALRPEQIGRAKVFIQQVASVGRCAPTPAPSAAADEEVVKAIGVFEDNNPSLKKAMNTDIADGFGLQVGSRTIKLDESPEARQSQKNSEAYNPMGFCPLHTKEERVKAAESVGGGIMTRGQYFDEFNVGLMAMSGKPINPATDHGLLETGPVNIDSDFFDPLNLAMPTWAGFRQAGLLLLALPEFILTEGRNRTLYFMNAAVSSCWNPDPLAMGPMLFKHDEVLAALTDPNQRRGYYTGTALQHRVFFHPETLLFLDGDRHKKLRDILELSGFARRYAVDVELARRIPVAEGCTVPESEDFAKAVGVMVQTAIWGREPPSEIVAELQTYAKFGAFGIFGSVIEPVLGPVGIAEQVKTARDNVAAWAKTTPFADLFLKARDNLEPEHPWFLDGDVLLDGIGIASLFAGLVGTMDMATKCVSFQKQELRHQTLFMQDPERYLIELMRFDGAVTSVTDLMQEETDMTLEGQEITFKAGSPRQLVLATSNRDPTFWENPSLVDPDRSQLEDNLAWNGRAVDVEARSLEKAPRHCPGMCLSLKVAASVCASMMGVLEEMVENGKILANDGAVKCNNFGEHEEPELWTPPAPTPVGAPSALDADWKFSHSGEAELIKAGFDCNSPSLDMGRRETLFDCLEAVKSAGGKFFIYGHGWLKQKRCYIEFTKSAECEEGWRRSSYNFYDVPAISLEDSRQGRANVVELSIGGAMTKPPWWKFWASPKKPAQLQVGILEKEQVSTSGQTLLATRTGKVYNGFLPLRSKYCSRQFRLGVFGGGTGVETYESCCYTPWFNWWSTCEIPATEHTLGQVEVLTKGELWNVCRQESDTDFFVMQQSWPALRQPVTGECLSVDVASETVSIGQVLNMCPSFVNRLVWNTLAGLKVWWGAYTALRLDKGDEARDDMFSIEELIGKTVDSSILDPVTFDAFSVMMTLSVLHLTGRRISDSHLPASERMRVPTGTKYLDRHTQYDFLGSPREDPDFPGVEPISAATACMVGSIIGLPFEDDVVEGDDNSWSLILGLKDGYPSSCPDDKATCTKKEFLRGVYDGYETPSGTGVYPPEYVNYAERWYADGEWADQAETALAWSLYAVHHVEVSTLQETAFVIRTNVLNKFSQRPGFGEPGADMYFDAEGAPVMIDTPRGVKLWRSEVDTKTWQYWKFVWRSSIFLKVTMMDHLWATHYGAANALCGASREALPSIHPFRRLLTVFTYNTVFVNTNAVHALVGPNAILQRSTPFSDFKQVATVAQESVPSMQATFGMFVSHETMKSLPEKVQHAPFYEDGQVLFDALRELVDSWFEVYPEWCQGGDLVDEHILLFWKRLPTWSLITQNHFDQDSEFVGFYGPDGSTIRCDGFKKWLTVKLFRITGFHRHVGAVTDDAIDPDWAGFSWKLGEAFGRPRQALETSLISSFTAKTWPKLSEDYGFITEGMDKAEEGGQVLADFNLAMQKLKELVEQRNTQRAIPYLSMHPDHVETSVAT